jgi:hypothetical protein
VPVRKRGWPDEAKREPLILWGAGWIRREIAGFGEARERRWGETPAEAFAGMPSKGKTQGSRQCLAG